MDFDKLTIVLLELRPDAPQLDDTAAAALQDAHLDHLATLREQGYLVAAGPLAGGGELRGLSILRTDEEEARRLKEADPAVRAGRFALRIMSWQVPAGAMSFAAARFPHSVAEVTG